MFFDRFSKKKSPDEKNGMANEDILKILLEQQAQRSPSDQFASGAIFDIFRQQREAFGQVVHSNDAMSLKALFVNAYSSFLNNPEVVGFAPNMVNKSNDDTDPRTWNANIFSLSTGDHAALLYIPIQNSALAARVVGIMLGNQGDGYYYCMLNKDETVLSDVNRNNAIYGIEKIGEIKGRGFGLIIGFLNCIRADFYREINNIT